MWPYSIEFTDDGHVMHGRRYFSSPEKYVQWLERSLPGSDEVNLEISIFCGDNEGIRIANALSGNIWLHQFDLANGLMTDASADAFANTLQKHPNLERFSFWDQKITAQGAANIINKARVKDLNLSYNNIADEKFILLCNAIRENKHLNRLELHPLDINQENIGHLKSALEFNGRISYFSWGLDKSTWKSTHRADLEEIEIITAINFCRTAPIDQVFENFPDILEENWEAVSGRVCSAINANLSLAPISRPLKPEDFIAMHYSFINRNTRGNLVWLYTRGSAVEEISEDGHPVLGYRNGHSTQDRTLKELLLASCSMTELCTTILQDCAWSSDDESDSDSESELDYKYSFPVVPSATFVHSDEHRVLLAALNKILETGGSPEYDQFPPVNLPFFRGIHYLKNKFPKQKRKLHRNTDHSNQSIFSSAVFDLATQRNLNPNDTEQYELLADEVKQPIIDLNEASPTNKLSPSGKTKGRSHPTPRAAFQELYTNNYEGIHRLLEAGEDKRDILKKFPSAYNPQVSTSEEAKHAVKYALGAKVFRDKDRHLHPHYRTQLRPKHPYLGKVTVILVPLADIGELDPAFVVQMHHDCEVSISHHFSKDILSEREVSFPGWIPGRYVKFEISVRVPNFSHEYKDFHSKKYGLSRAEYLNLRKALINTFGVPRHQEKFLEKLFLKLVSHYQSQLAEIAENISGAYLMYRSLGGGIQFTLSSIDQAKLNHDRLAAEYKDNTSGVATSLYAQQSSPSSLSSKAAGEAEYPD